MDLRILIFICVVILEGAIGCVPQPEKSVASGPTEELRSLCHLIESNSLFVDYEQRLHGYLSELSTLFVEVNPPLMTAGEQFFNELRATFPLRAGMSINRVHTVIQQESFIRSTPHSSEDSSVLWVFFLGNGTPQNIFSSAWVEISVENSLVQSICIAPGNFSVVFPGFLFDGALLN